MPQKQYNTKRQIFHLVIFTGLIIIFLIVTAAVVFEKKYANKAYPQVLIDTTSVGNKTAQEIEEYWLTRNQPFEQAIFELRFENYIATVSGLELGVGYDATLSATQALQIGRSGHLLADLYQKLNPAPLPLTPLFRFNTTIWEEKLALAASYLDLPVQDALFQFANGKVTAFKPSRPGRRLNLEAAQQQLKNILPTIPRSSINRFVINLSVEVVEPAITTERVNSFGIKELLGTGYSEFAGSIAGRVHNISLAATKLNGILIKPGDIFSFNDAVGDISATTGFQPAYIIKDGRTVLGDGGGVCQVSTTLFRAALSAGLPVIERQAHAYRVGYYELAGFKPGLDATVFAPSVDLQIKNNTPAYILIQTKIDKKTQRLTFELYGTSDGRTAQVFNHKVWDISPPPPPVYQDDPTLPAGVTKQVDWSAWGAKASFDYKVVRNGETLFEKTFFSNFRPWQAVYLRGIQ